MNLKILFLSFKISYVRSFLLTVLLISYAVGIYSLYYMIYRKILKYFFIIKLIFVLSIIVLLTSESFFVLFLGWDGLGITSYLLVIFYLNWKSQNAGIITILSNRFGDFLLFILFVYIRLNNLFLISSINLIISKTFIVLISIICFTKRAQFPFSSWLPFAIAAPTPISSLVHSSTLVTAGIIVILQIIDFFSSSFLIQIIMVFRLLTINYSGLLRVYEKDFKKIIALSTLNQLSFIFLTIRINLKFCAFFHLNTHAIFKRILFINIGILIHLILNQQDKRLYRNLLFLFNFIIISSFLSLINLIGGIFLRGFFSKDIILEFFFSKNFNLFLIFLFLWSVLFTFFYSLRIFKVQIFVFKKNIIYTNNFIFLIIPSILIRYFRLFFGKIFFCNIINIFFCNFLYFSQKFIILSLIFLISLFFIFFKKILYFSRFYIFSIILLDFFVLSLKKIKNKLIFLFYSEKISLNTFFLNYSTSLFFFSKSSKNEKQVFILFLIFLCFLLY